MAAAAAAALPPPSPFAALLRRSKFASFDPQIAQVYTTHGGDAHRGNWGLKRPLAVRKRGKHITVQAVDSPEQQTEWRHADSEGLWIKRWNELGAEASLRGGDWDRIMGTVKRNLWLVDTDFGLGVGKEPMTRRAEEEEEERRAAERAEADVRLSEEEEKAAEHKARLREAALTEKRTRAVVPTVNAMSPQAYARYIRTLRAQRPAFAAFLEQEMLKDTAKHREHERRTGDMRRPRRMAGTPRAQAVLDTAEVVQRAFLQDRALAAAHRPDARAIEQQPHRTAGLSYALEAPLTSFFLTAPQPGRYLTPHASTRRPVAIAGMVGYIGHYNADAADADALRFRVTAAQLHAAPTAVAGRLPGGLHGVRLDTKLREVSTLNMLRATAAAPGSREYVALGDAAQAAPGRRADRSSMTRGGGRGRAVADAKKAGAVQHTPIDLLSTLADILANRVQPPK
ncbi:hypothetical protein FA95DRAFT_1562275 [Auriscalpium vulgare]|uniref:Uncharacterized protein n=1 Tax=Auriscalpium vulgare TaxID=40419 RepID=A0ACB8RKU5_9AGAM|nr:hypothetical protein FA95DRAFT_1562275 [Auriscalpium vulgare]